MNDTTTPPTPTRAGLHWILVALLIFVGAAVVNPAAKAIVHVLGDRTISDRVAAIEQRFVDASNRVVAARTAPKPTPAKPVPLPPILPAPESSRTWLSTNQCPGASDIAITGHVWETWLAYRSSEVNTNAFAGLLARPILQTCVRCGAVRSIQALTYAPTNGSVAK